MLTVNWSIVLVFVVRAVAVTAEPRYCFTCSRMPSPSDCGHVIKCGDHEVCSITQYVTDGGHVYYDSGCKDESEESIGDIIVCSECCNGSYCNSNGCGTSPLPARESRGPFCFNCASEIDPAFCEDAVICQGHESCLLQKHTNPVNKEIRYRSHCATQSQCDAIHDASPVLVGKRQEAACSGCCNDDFCNRNCDALTNATLLVPTKPMVTMTTTQTLPTTVKTTTVAPIQATVKPNATAVDIDSIKLSICEALNYTYIRHLDFCVKFYTFDRLNWTDARRRCLRDGGDLAVFHTVGAEAVVANWLEQHYNEWGTIEDIHFYVGGYLNSHRNTWMWVDNTTVDLKELHPEELSRQHNQNCLSMYINKFNGLVALSDDYCNRPERFICSIQSHEVSTLGQDGDYCRNDDYTEVRNMGLCYKVHEQERLSLSDARRVCHSEGAELLQFKNKEVETYFQHVHFAQNMSNIGSRYWLAAVRTTTGLNTFIWLSGSLFTATDGQYEWSPGEPNNYGGAKEDCVSFMYSSSTQRLALNDDHCHDRLDFICEEQCPNITYTFYPNGPLCFRVVDTPATLQDALNICQEEHSTLMQFNHFNHTASLHMITNFMKFTKRDVNAYWVGAYFVQADLQFHWIVDDHPIPQTLWNPEPSFLPPNERCVALERSPIDHEIRLNNRDCGQSLPFICQNVW